MFLFCAPWEGKIVGPSGATNTNPALTTTTYAEADMAKRELPSPEVLRQLLRYEPETGKLFWRERSPELFLGRSQRYCQLWNFRWSGREAGTISTSGYRVICIFYHLLSAHRIIWAMANNEWAEENIDHIDRDTSNNRIDNLRLATKQQNAANAAPSGGSSKYRGVSKMADSGKWRAYISKDGKQKYLGTFLDEKQAAAAYDTHAKRLFGEFAYLNLPSCRAGNQEVTT
jgi:hypothetical protein